MKIQGTEILSSETLKAARRLIVTSSIVFAVKGYRLNLENLTVFQVDIAPHLFDVVALTILVFGLVSFAYNWLGDAYSFTNWYEKHEIWSQLKTNMPIDRTFYNGACGLLVKLYENENSINSDASIETLPDQERERYQDFKNNVELYIARLEAHQQSFHTISLLGRIYVFILWGLVPIIFTLLAFIALYSYGDFPLPFSIAPQT